MPNNEAERPLKSAAEEHVPSDFEKKTREAAPDVKADFDKAHANDDRQTTGAGEGSEQVQQTSHSPRIPPPPGLDHAGARQAHQDAMYRDGQAAKARNENSKEEQRQKSKEEFLQRRATEKEKERSEERDRGRE